jgi:hypothetical protein
MHRKLSVDCTSQYYSYGLELVALILLFIPNVYFILNFIESVDLHGLARRRFATFSLSKRASLQQRQTNKEQFLMGGPFDFGEVDAILKHLP